MAVFKPRERLVYFRISEDEYRQFTSVCEQAGARSVSDLARNAVQRLIADGQRDRQEDQMEQKLRVLERLIAELKEQLRLLGAKAPGEAGNLAMANGTDSFLPEPNQFELYEGKER